MKAKMPVKRALGPLDKRKRVIRCQACSVRKIRCAGGFPCECCIRTGQTCRKQDERQSTTVFVFHTADAIDQSYDLSGKSLPTQMTEKKETRILDYFFAFFCHNQFVRNSESLAKALLPLLQTSPLLYSAVTAVGALDAARRGSCSAYSRTESPHFIALRAYSNSIGALQTALLGRHVAQRDDVLWSTFFLGLFELMVDPSGAGWAKHMLSGTSRLLQLAGPQQQMSALRKTFLELFRVLEANRAVLYGDDTILSHPYWFPLQQIQASRAADGWDSLDGILSLMIRISAFNLRFFEYARIMANSGKPDPFIDKLGTEGVEIQDSLFKWLREAPAQSDRGKGPNFGYHQALAYCHALLIFLFNSFEYYPHLNPKHAPRLSQLRVDYHVDSILEQADSILNISAGSGVLLFFPLRVAGTRAKEIQRARILGMLDRVLQSGFVVSERIKADLQEYWDYKKRIASTVEIFEI